MLGIQRFTVSNITLTTQGTAFTMLHPAPQLPLCQNSDNGIVTGFNQPKHLGRSRIASPLG
jgi:hypothetical protein